MAKRVILKLAVACCIMLASPKGAAARLPVEDVVPSNTEGMYCQDLMDLEIPMDDEGQGANLPPLSPGPPEVPERLKTTPRMVAPETPAQDAKFDAPSGVVPPARLASPKEVGGSEEEPLAPAFAPMPIKSYTAGDVPSPVKSAEELAAVQPTPGISPAILPQPPEGEGLEVSPIQPVEVPEQTVSAEVPEPPSGLKAIQPPPAKTFTLKVPSEATTAALPASSAPDIPLLDEKKTAATKGSPVEPAAPLALKTVGPRVASLENGSAPVADDPSQPREGSYTGRWEDLDQKLIDLYEKYYK